LFFVFVEYRRGVHSIYALLFKEIGPEGVDWIQLAQDNDWWRAIMNTGFIKGG
jgi:hypothetical protein